MYNYDFKKENESILKEIININTKIGNKYYITNLILTEKNLLIFYDMKNEDYKLGVGINPFPNFYLLFSIPLKDLNYEIKENDTYIKTNNQEINFYDLKLEEFLNKEIK